MRGGFGDEWSECGAMERRSLLHELLDQVRLLLLYIHFLLLLLQFRDWDFGGFFLGFEECVCKICNGATDRYYYCFSFYRCVCFLFCVSYGKSGEFLRDAPTKPKAVCPCFALFNFVSLHYIILSACLRLNTRWSL